MPTKENWRENLILYYVIDIDDDIPHICWLYCEPCLKCGLHDWSLVHAFEARPDELNILDLLASLEEPYCDECRSTIGS